MPDYKVGWQARRVGNDAFIREVRSDGTFQDFGPFRNATEAFVKAFVTGRRQIIQHYMSKDGAIERKPTSNGGGGHESIPRNDDAGADLEPWDSQDDPIDYIKHGKEEGELE